MTANKKAASSTHSNSLFFADISITCKVIMGAKIVKMGYLK